MISKQTQKAFSYIFALLAISLGSLLLVALAQGYRYDFLTGQVKEYGLVLIDTRPSNADIYINGRRTKKTSPQRMSDALVGPMTLELVKPNFRTWRKELLIQAQQVSYADYALLIPQKLSYKTYVPEYVVSQLVQSENHKRSFIITSKPQVAVWRLDDLGNPTRMYAPPANSGDVELTNLRVNADGSRLIVQQRVGTSSTTLAITDIDASLNLTANLQATNGSFSFNPSNNNELYWISDDKNLRKISLNSQTVGAVLAQNVISIAAQGSQIYAVLGPDTESTKSTLWKLDPSQGKKTKINAGIPESSSYSLDFARFAGGNYLALLANTTKELIIIREPDAQKPLSSLLAKNVTGFTINSSGAFIVYNSGDRLKTYDIDLAERFDFGSSLVAFQSWQWLDTHHVIVQANNQLRIIDYDGQNDQTISDQGDSVGFAGLVDRNHSALYTTRGTLKSTVLIQ